MGNARMLTGALLWEEPGIGCAGRSSAASCRKQHVEFRLPRECGRDATTDPPAAAPGAAASTLASRIGD